MALAAPTTKKKYLFCANGTVAVLARSLAELVQTAAPASSLPLQAIKKEQAC